MPKITGGYYLKARSIQNSKIAHAPPHVREIWDWLIKEANHKDNKCNGLIIKRGQCLRSYKDIQEGLHWMIGWRKMKYKKTDCETTMKWLKAHAMITTKKTTYGMLITILNYDRYQTPENYETYKKPTTKPTRNLQTDDTFINKNVKNVKNVNKKINIYTPLRDYLLKKISESGLVLSKEKVLEFFEYRMNKPKKEQYKTEKGIDGLFRDLNNCRDAGLNIKDCIDIAMEKDWQTPDARYFHNKTKMTTHLNTAVPLEVQDDIDRLNREARRQREKGE